MDGRIDISTEDIAKALDSLVNKLQEIGGKASSEIVAIIKQLWPCFVRQARVDAIHNTVVGSCMIAYNIVGIFVYHWLFRLITAQAAEHESTTGLWWAVGVHSALMIGFFICALALLGEVLTGILNPQYYALDLMKNKITDVIDSIRGSKESITGD